jgi:hypothetical protein
VPSHENHSGGPSARAMDDEDGNDVLEMEEWWAGVKKLVKQPPENRSCVEQLDDACWTHELVRSQTTQLGDPPPK